MDGLCVLGYELDRAVRRLEQAGFRSVAETEARSRKGLVGNERRVVRQKPVPGDPNCFSLTYAVFCTQLKDEDCTGRGE